MIPKFRAWEKNMNAMIPVENIDFLAKQINTNSAWRMFHEVELMQYTGLKDKNGVEIYEGDILHWTSEAVAREDWIGLVERINAEFNVWTSKRARSSGGWLNVAAEKIEVIGNIYENPELIE